MQNKSGGLGSAFGGGGENYFGKNKSKTKEARLGLLTKINAGVIAVLAVVLVLMLR
jgi:protein translocase SecG subunit